MGYFNLILQYGLLAFLKQCKKVGVDGLIIVDLPYPENKYFANQCKQHGITFVQLLSPTTSKQRIKKIIKDSHDMIYYISMLSTTGGKLKVSAKKILANYSQIKKINSRKKIVIGFGITTKTIVTLKKADGLVVGSQLCKEIWITKFIKPKIEFLFKKKTSESDQILWTTCECKNLIYKEDLQKNFNCCPKCGAHHKLSCIERFTIFFDDKKYKLIDTPLPKDDPINFVDTKKYIDRLKTARKITKQNDAVAIATGKVEDIQVTVGAQDFRFIGGSFGAASGEAFIYGAQHAIDNKNPFIFFSCSGGQRMMESSIALMQMSRTVLAVNASWAMLGDILIAEPKATIGFAGRRVIQDTVRETLPEEFQTAEYVQDHGGLDLVVERKYLRSTINTLLTVLLKKGETQVNTDTSNVISLDTPQKSSKAL